MKFFFNTHTESKLNVTLGHKLFKSIVFFLVFSSEVTEQRHSLNSSLSCSLLTPTALHPSSPRRLSSSRKEIKRRRSFGILSTKYRLLFLSLIPALNIIKKSTTRLLLIHINPMFPWQHTLVFFSNAYNVNHMKIRKRWRAEIINYVFFSQV